MFYRLDSFIRSLPPFFHQAMGSNLTFLHRFLTFYADLIKWADGLTGWPTQSAGRHDVPGLELWPTGVWPMPGRRLAIYRRLTN
jgi:hypothetical protein